MCLAVGCDGGGRMPDAQTQPAAYSSELSVRFEVSPSGGPDRQAMVSVLGFRAAAAGPETDVLGLVDPLAAAPPDQGCVLRDVDLANRALATRGGSVDLEELGGVGVGLGGAGTPSTVIRTFPRVYPDVAGVVGGVVGEAAPQPIASLPEHVSLLSPASELPVAELAVPALPKLLSINGSAPAAGLRIDATGGLSLSLAAAGGAFIELRPFGATVVVSCAVPNNAAAESVVTVPRALLAHLRTPDAAGTGNAANVGLSVEIARRVQVREPLVTAGTRVSVEVRSTLAVELRP
ncbi:MAG TPA: hypothetical protein VN903_10725 [Polyangia bacterium]|nr:hypothetical protein [Polyangia bacterium]